jgi:DNA ligase-1
LVGIGLRAKGIEQKYVTISKIGTGLTDEQWRELKVRSEEWKVTSQPEEYEVNKNLVPDVWLRLGIVVEIQADNITRSPTHTAGLALRFPRLVRFRDDKSPAQVTNLTELGKLYEMQKI